MEAVLGDKMVSSVGKDTYCQAENLRLIPENHIKNKQPKTLTPKWKKNHATIHMDSCSFREMESLQYALI